MTVLDEFLQASSAEITRRAALKPGQPILAEGASAFAEAVQQSTAIDASLKLIGVSAHLAAIEPATTPRADLTTLAIDAADQVPWVPTPRIDGDHGETVGLGLIDAVRDFGDIIVGFMLLAPTAAYPEHTHPPQEIYLPIAGRGRWRFGGAENYVQLAADGLVYNNPGDLHSAVAGDEPELALYFLWP